MNGQTVSSHHLTLNGNSTVEALFPLEMTVLERGESKTWKNADIVGRVPQIDGLRGVAILMVFFFHYVSSQNSPRHPWFTVVTSSTSLFWSGVDLFFVLSGFLIAGILIDSAQSHQYFRTFYLRRFHRIFPLYFFWLALLCLGVLFHLDRSFSVPVFDSRVPLWMYPIFLQNQAALWLGVYGPPWMAMSWSLAVEEQFYIVLPAIIRLCSKTTLFWLCCLTVALSPFYRITVAAAHPELDPGWTFGTLSRLDGLALGALVALIARTQGVWDWLKRRPRTLAICSASLFAVFLILTYTPRVQHRMALFGFTCISMFYASVLLLVLCQQDGWTSRLLRNSFLKYFGKISFAIYILHQGCHALAEGLIPKLGWHLNFLRFLTVSAVSVLVTIGLAQLSWTFMESKLIKRAHARYKY